MNIRRTILAKKLIVNPSNHQMRKMAADMEITTEFGSPSYISKIKNRSAKFTYIVDNVPLGVAQKPISEEKASLIEKQILSYLEGQEVIQIDRLMGMGSAAIKCRLYITKQWARIAMKWANTLFPPMEGQSEMEADIVSIYVPELNEGNTTIFADMKKRVTYITGTDYFGESKKSFLRQAMYMMKEKGGLGLHAGSKVLRIKKGEEQLQDVGFILFGLSGTGKTTLTVHDHHLTGEEGVIIRQDDVVLMGEDGYCFGTENGFYIKTEGLEPSQKVLYQAAVSENAVFDNIWVDEQGKVDFCNVDITSNGRGVVLREEIAMTDENVDLSKANKVVFITRRNDIMPVVAKLTPEQGAAFFMLGESIETSAGDPTKAGQSKREVGTNPFIVGPEGLEGNRLLKILKANPDMECYILNTGSVGAGKDFSGEKITIKISTEIMKQIAKEGITWELDPDWGYLVPKEIEGIDMSKYRPQQYYSVEAYQGLVEKLRNERINWLRQFKELDREILEVIVHSVPKRAAI